jgi:plastocyanin
MRANALYIATAILCFAACSKSSGNGTTAANGSGTGTGTDTGSGYGTNPQDPAPTAPNTVNANPTLDFNPASLTVTHGTMVNFVFGSVAHTVTFTSAGAPASIPATSNATVGVTFPTAGVYTYMCSIHTQMMGTVTVQ